MKRDTNLTIGLIFSFLFHGLLLSLFWVNLPWGKVPLEPPHPIPVEIVPIDSISRAPALKPKPMPKPKPPEPEPKPEVKPEEPKPVEATEQPLIPEKKPELLPKPEPEPEPEAPGMLPPPEPKPESEKPKEKEKDKKPAEKPKEAPKKEKKAEKPKPKKKDDKAKPKKLRPESKVDELLKNLEDTADDGIDQLLDETDPTSDSVNAAPEVGTLSMSEMDLLRQQMRRCWRIPAGAKDAGDLSVVLEMEMNPDATVKNVKVLPGQSSTRHAFYQAGLESALRAVQDPQCTPLKLPLDKYDSWKTFTFRFSPRM
ncbi:MAG: energy transducer TonB [Alphaproteobacteria bacterium]